MSFKTILLIITMAMGIQFSSAYNGKRVHLHEAFIRVERDWHIRITDNIPLDELEEVCMEGWSEHPPRCPEHWRPHTEFLTHSLGGQNDNLLKCTRNTHCVTTY